LTIIGNGLIANALESCVPEEILFAAGVSDSACPDEMAFDREIRLLTETLRYCELENRRLVYFSSAGRIYGELAHPRNEKTVCTPTTRYGVHKLECESRIQSSNCSYLIARLPNLVGPTKNRNQLVPQLVLQALSGQASILVRATRDLLGVDRMKNILLELLGNVGKRETVVVASGVSISAMEMIAEIQSILNCKVNVTPIDAGDQQEFEIDFLRQLAPKNSVFEPDYPVRLLQQFVPAIADSLRTEMSVEVR